MFLYLYIIYFFIATIHASSYLPVSKCPKEDTLRKCLDQYHVKGDVNFRDNYTAYSKDLNIEYNRLVMHFPVAFVHPIDVFDVQSAIKCAVKLNLPIVARSGGHSYEGYGIGDKNCYLVVDLVALNKITIDVTSQTAVIGPGNLLDPLYYEVNKYGFAFPAGTCPYTGVGGHITGGGMGLLNRKFGMSSDNILDAEIVLANGTIIYNAKNYPELLWAIRGAGNAGYGIITALTIRIHPILNITTTIRLWYDFDQTPLLFSAVNQLGSNLHQNITLSIIILEQEAHIHGTYLGSASELKSHIQEFIELSKPQSVEYTESDFYNALVQAPENSQDPGFFKVKSFFVDLTGLSYEGIKDLMSFHESFTCQVSSAVMLIGGGKVNEIGRNETAFVHRDFLFHIELKTIMESETDIEICLQEVESFSQHFQHNYASYENYQNLIDRQLDNWQYRYYGENFEKLVEIKRNYDPHNLFHWNQSIPTNI